MSERILTGVYPENDYRSYLRHSDEVEQKYGLPDKKKYPMPDRDHVMSAIKFFNYVSPSDEKELARNIIARIKEYGITDINVGENNRFGKYYKPDYLEHHGILGMKWGVRRYQNSDGSLTTAGKKHYSVKKTDMEADWDAKVKELGEDAAYNWLQNRVENESGDWYNGYPVSEGFKNVLDSYDAKARKLEKKYNLQKKSGDTFGYRYKKILQTTKKYFDENGELKKEYKNKKGRAEADKAFEDAWNKVEKDPKYKELVSSYHSDRDRYQKEYNELRSDFESHLTSVALNDLGYKDTEAARKRIKSVIFWD